MKQATCYLCIGTNIGDRISNIDDAIQKLINKGINVIIRSSLYESEPWGYESSNKFINCCISVTTDLEPEELLKTIKSIEKQLGRNIESINSGYSDRIIDIDIIFYDDLLLKQDNLTIPHPKFQDRNFVLIPLAEICPNFITPHNKLTIEQLLINSKDNNHLNRVEKS